MLAFPFHLETAKQQLRWDRHPKKHRQEAEKLGLRLNHLMSGDFPSGAMYTVTGRKTGYTPSLSSNVLAIGGEILG